MNINGSTNIYSLYNTLYQSNMSIINNKLSQKYSPVNKTKTSEALSPGSVKYVSGLKSSAKDIAGALKQLTSGEAFNKKAVTSSDTDVLSVEAKDGKSSKPLSVNVDRIATGQTNEGSELRSNAIYGGSGTSKFSIESGGKTTQFSVNVAAGDTNKDVQQKMADAINKAGIGVKATVEVDSKNNTSMLKLESTGTGNDEKNKFTFTDNSGSLASKTGVNNITQQAQNAIYRVDGGAAKESKSNTVDLGNGVSATFKKASDKAVTISDGVDKSYAKNAVKELVNGYNSLYSATLENSSDPKANKLFSKLTGISRTYAKSLSDIGIGFDKDGKMTIDSEKLTSAMENGKLEKFFTENGNKNYGFAAQLGRLAGSVANNTSNYVSKSYVGSSLTENFSYGNLGNTQQYNYFNAGLLFDYSY